MKMINYQAGFTILELMAAVTVAGILLAVALPSYHNLTRNNCLTTKANSLIASLQIARSEAVKRRANIDVIATNSASSTNKWGTGWTVQVSGGGDVIRVVELACDATTVDNSVTTYTYNSQGFINNPAGTFAICDDRTGETGREITLSTTGRPSTNNTFVCP